MTAFEYIKNHVNVKLAPSTISGVGVFALRDIKRGETLFTYWTGETGTYTLTEQELNLLEYDVKMHLFDMYEYSQENGKWDFSLFLVNQCHWIFKSPMHWVNSCSWDSSPNLDRDTFIALKDIPRGQEILTKYGKYEKYQQLRTI